MSKKVKHITSSENRTAMTIGKKLRVSLSSGIVFDDRFNEIGKARVCRTKLLSKELN